MERVEKTVFLSYRPFDYNGIASGDFEKVILENIRARYTLSSSADTFGA